MKKIQTPYPKDSIAALCKGGSHDLAAALEAMMSRQPAVQPEDHGMGKTVYSSTVIDLSSEIVRQVKEALRRADQLGQQQGEYDLIPSRALMGWESAK